MSLGVTSAAAGIALVLGLTSVFGAAPARGTGTIRTAAFTLTSYTNGTVSLNLRQLFVPAALQRALTQVGIPALVKADSYCSSHPAAPDPGSTGVVTVPAPPAPPGAPAGPSAGRLHRAVPVPGGGIMASMNLPVLPSQLTPTDADTLTWVLNPTAIPSGTELYLGYFNLGHTLFMDLVYTDSHTCIYGQVPPAVARADRPPSAKHS